MNGAAPSIDIVPRIEYDFFRFWNANLFQWVPAEVVEKKKEKPLIEEILDLCNKTFPDILNKYDGKPVFAKNVRYHLNHIRYPKFLFTFPSSLGDINLSCRIRINPCLAPQYKHFRHSKIWVIMANLDTVNYSSNDLLNIYFELSGIINNISEIVRKCYLIPVIGEVTVPYFDIVAKTASIANDFIDKETSEVLFSEKNDKKKVFIDNFDKIELCLADLFLLNNEKETGPPFTYFIENFNKYKWKLSTFKDTKLIYSMKPPQNKRSNFSGIASITSDRDKRDILRRLFLPTALELIRQV